MGIHIIPDKDNDGRQIVKAATTDKGWAYIADCIEVNLSKHGSAAFYHADKNDADRGQVTAKIFDAQGAEITDPANEANAVKTELIFSPGYDIDIIAGSVWQNSKPGVDIRLWTEGGIIAIPNATKHFVSGLNLRFLDQAKTDGRSSKKLFKDHEVAPGVFFRGDNLIFTITYPAGNTHEFFLMVEYYRA